MLKEKDNVIKAAMAILDAATVGIVFLMSFALRPYFYVFYKFDIISVNQVIADTIPVSLSDALVVLLVAMPLWCLMLFLSGMYRPMRTKTAAEIVWVVVRAAFFTTLAFGTFVFLFKLRFVSRLFFTVFLGAASAFIVSEKLLIFTTMKYLRRQGYNSKSMLVVGTGARAASFIGRIRSHSAWGFKIVGVIEDNEEPGSRKVDPAEIIGTLKDIPEIIKARPVDEVVFVVASNRLGDIADTLFVCETAGIRSTVAVDFFDLKLAKARTSELEGIPLVTFETAPAKEWHLFIKRCFDVLASGAGILLLSPFFLIVAALIKATSPGQIFFQQKRVGLNGRSFVLHKFRTMREGAEGQAAAYANRNMMSGPVFKIKDDPRVTRLGRILRRFSIDELPQLFNIFAGCLLYTSPSPRD